MSQRNRDIEGGGGSDGHRPSPSPLPPIRPLHSPEDGSDDDDSSWALYSMYFKIAEEEDNEVVERCQRDADGTLIFTGLFSATVGALLTISFPDLKPNSQDTSAFYLQNLYQLQFSGNPNISHPSTPSALAKPPAFSPPRYVIWVNSLWFLSLTVSLSGALVATLYRNWAVQYISISQWPWGTLAKRVRMRALFSKINPGPYHTIWGTGYEANYLHLSVLLFIVGSLIYLFNINRAVFYAVVWWVCWMTLYYAVQTLGVFDEPHDLFHTPLSEVGLSIYLGISYLVFRVCSCIPPLRGIRDSIKKHHRNLSNRYSEGVLIGKQRAVKEIALKPSSEIDTLVLERILLSLDEDPALETFFDAIPGFCNSKLCFLPLSSQIRAKLRQVIDGFLNRTFSSRLVSESVRVSRLITCLNAAHTALSHSAVSEIMDNTFNGNWDTLQSVEMGHALRLWGHRRDHDLVVQQIIARIIPRARERDDRWTTLVKEEFGVPDDVFRDGHANGDSVLLLILIHISHRTIRVGPWTFGILSSLSEFNIRNALPGLQHEFCSFWNETVQLAGDQGPFGTSARVLRDIRHLYIALHRGNDFSPTAFSASTSGLNSLLERPLMYPLCDIASHRPDSTTHVPVALSGAVHPLGVSLDALPHQFTLRGGTNLRLAEGTNIITGLPSPPDPSTTSEIGESPDLPTATFLGHSSSPSSDRISQDGVATPRPDTTSMESHKQQGLATSYVAPLEDIGGISSTVPASVPAETSTTPVLNTSSGTHEASTAFISTSLLPSSSSVFSAPEFPESLPPPNVPPLPTPEPFPLVSGTSPEGPSDNTTPLRSHPRKLDNNGNVYLASAVLQSLVYCPPFRELFRDVGQSEGGEIGGGATPLVDATVRFLDEFAYKEKSSMTHQAARSKPREDGDEKKEDEGVHSFLSTDVYDALMEKRQFISIRDDQQEDAAAFSGLYLEALDEELVMLQPPISKHKPAPTLKADKLEEETRSPAGEGQTEVEERDCTSSSVKSPISVIFGGRSRSTVRVPNQPDTVTVEDWRSLKLNIEPDSVHTIQDALAHVSQPKPVQVDKSSPGEASQQVLLETLPPVFVLHLERFLYDAGADGINKIRKPVQFTADLDIPLEIMVPVAGKSVEPAHYKLYGVLYHRGESASGGHYTVDVLHPNGDNCGGEGWVHIDDDGLSKVRHEDVFGRHSDEQVDDQCAYMLFYCRTAPVQI